MTFHNLVVKLECRENYDCYKQLSDDNKAKIIVLGSIDADTDDAVLKEKESKTFCVKIAKLANWSWKHLSNTESSAVTFKDRKLHTTYRLVTTSN